jgi:hypothetical protein
METMKKRDLQCNGSSVKSVSSLSLDNVSHRQGIRVAALPGVSLERVELATLYRFVLLYNSCEQLEREVGIQYFET